jgi:surfeit locus 1 family protein
VIQLLTPRRIAQHLLVLLVVVGLSWLGFWQLERLGEVRASNADQAARLEEPPAAVDDLLDGLVLDDTEDLAELEFRPVTATGTWRTDDEVLQRGRSLDGRNGYDVLTPLDLGEGRTVLVRRGWVPFDNDLLPPVPDAAPPPGTTTVTGYVARSIPQPTGPIAQRDPDDGDLDVVFNADLGRLDPQVVADGSRLLPMIVHLEGQLPAQSGDLPVPQPRPEQDEGTHLSYAFQWFAFALTGIGFYAVLLRRSLRGDASLRSVPVAGEPPG